MLLPSQSPYLKQHDTTIIKMPTKRISFGEMLFIPPVTLCRLVKSMLCCTECVLVAYDSTITYLDTWIFSYNSMVQSSIVPRVLIFNINTLGHFTECITPLVCVCHIKTHFLVQNGSKTTIMLLTLSAKLLLRNITCLKI